MGLFPLRQNLSFRQFRYVGVKQVIYTLNRHAKVTIFTTKCPVDTLLPPNDVRASVLDRCERRTWGSVGLNLSLFSGTHFDFELREILGPT